LAPCEDTKPPGRAGQWVMGARAPPQQHLLPAAPAPLAPHVPPTHVFPGIPWLPESSRLPLAAGNKQKAGAHDDAWGREQLWPDPPLPRAGSCGALGPHSPPEQHSPSRPWVPASLGRPWSPAGGRAVLGEGVATGLARPSAGRGQW